MQNLFFLLSFLPLFIFAEISNFSAEGLLINDSENGLKSHEGPVAGLKAWESTIKEHSFSVTEDIGQRGSLSFWFYLPNEHSASVSNEKKNLPYILLKLDGFADFTSKARERDFVINSNWTEGDNEQRKWQNFPSLSKGWHHCLWRWDANKGLREAFIDGSAIFPNYAPLSTWKSVNPRQLKLSTRGGLLFSDLKLSSSYPSNSSILKMLPPKYQKRSDKIMGVADLGKLDLEQFSKGKVLYQNNFQSKQDIVDWTLEGDVGLVEIREDGMHQWHKEGDWVWPEGHMVNWCPQNFPASFIAEWEVDIVSEDGLCIVFFAAKGVNGKDIFNPHLQKRKGHFGKYINGDINCYHISYFAADRLTANLRRNPGFFLATNGPVQIHPKDNKVHKVTLIKDNNHIILAVDDKISIDFKDDGKSFGPIHQEGKIGFRQMYPSHAIFKKFKVWELK